MASDDAVDQGPCSSRVSFGASDRQALVVAWLKPEMPSGSAGWGNQSTTGASSGSWGVTWTPAVANEAAHRLLRPGAIVGAVAQLWSNRPQAEFLVAMAVHEVASSSSRGTATCVAA